MEFLLAGSIAILLAVLITIRRLRKINLPESLRQFQDEMKDLGVEVKVTRKD